MNEIVTTQSISVLLVDDHAIVREGVKRKLARMPEIGMIDEADNGNDALRMALKADYDVVLLDISLPGRSGVEILDIIRSEKPGLPVLMFSMYPEVPYALQMLKTGAAGYFYKENAFGLLVDAIRRVCSGGVYMSHGLSEHLAALLATDPIRTLHDLLSDQEFQVLRLIASGRSPAQIAKELHLSLQDVSKASLRILQMTNIGTESALADYAVRNGVLN